MFDAVLNHLLQSTLFAGVAGLLSLALRGSHARARYWIWLAASLKFLVPFSLFVVTGSYLASKLSGPLASPRWVIVMEEIRRPLTVPATASTYPVGTALPSLGTIAIILWLCGLAVVLIHWLVRVRRLSAIVQASVAIDSGRTLDNLRSLEAAAGMSQPVELRSCDSRLEPGVFGIVRPVLLLPAGIADCLDESQLEAIIAHELCHIRNRDNLLASCQMAIEAVFWFHPLIWWLGARLVEERERACDEEVLRTGREPEIYAESILRVCRYYLESPLVCVPGVTGADLKKRIEGIMSHRPVSAMGPARKTLLAVVATSAVCVPLAIGMMKPSEFAVAPPSGSAPREFAQVTIKPGEPGSHRVSIRTEATGSFSTSNASLRSLVGFAYNLREHQISGGPEWMDVQRYDITARSEPTSRIDEVRAMMRKLLEGRFKLTLRHNLQSLPIFEMKAGEGGLKIEKLNAGTHRERANVWIGRGHLIAPSISMSDLARVLSGQLGRTIEDRTGLPGWYAVKLNWRVPEGNLPGPPGPKLQNVLPPPDPNAPPLEIAIQDQLGLRLESKTGPVETVVIEHVDRVLIKN